MASILDLLNTSTGKQLIQGASQKTNTSPDKTAAVLSAAMPLILGAMKRNAATPEGAQNLNKALNDDRHNGSILDNIGDILSTSDNSKGSIEGLLNDGGGILGHILGGKQQRVEQTISKTSGVDASSVSQIIKIAAPILMGVLGNQKRKDNVDEGGLGGLLGSVLGSKSSHDQSLLETILDADGDGSVVDDVAGMVLGNGNKKKGGIGGMLGGLFGK